ncbi:MAG: DUF3465 domain-containing protein [Sulfurospirillum cavolei]|uniref:DUF3465 domain-containing protein n=1 Tax=Sulfurospirillum cavolei TaxID=366522 RepID=UPI0006941252|nr:DUF3465 domain-containing protein [Sulfurospirillum cavolei]MDY0265814.1 DUF3465 domain-containing protein [Sulfurospirillum cavolei]
MKKTMLLFLIGLNLFAGTPMCDSGKVVKLLSDDNVGNRHQRFIVKLASGKTLLIAHNIDIAPKVAPLQEGGVVTFCGDLETNDKGGVVHWTHHDPHNHHNGGFLEYNGKRYE